MKIRLEGTKGECEAALARISQVVTVLEASGVYPNRGRSALVRMYLEVRIPQDRPAGPQRELANGELPPEQ